MPASPDPDEVREKLRKTNEFLEVADVAVGGHFNAAVSLAVSAAINAADAILMLETGTYAMGRDHGEGVSRLRAAGRRTAANHLAAVLRLKSKSQYSSKRCTEREARSALVHAERMQDQAIALAVKKGTTK